MQAMKSDRKKRFEKAYSGDSGPRFECTYKGQGSYPLKDGMNKDRESIDFSGMRRLQILKQMSSQLYYHMKYKKLDPVEVQSMYMGGNVFMTSNVSQAIADVSNDPQVIDFSTMLGTAYENGSDKARSKRHARKLKAFMAGKRGDAADTDMRNILSSQPKVIGEDQISTITSTGGLYLVTHDQGDVRHAEHVLSGRVGNNEAWIAGKKIPCFVCHVEFGCGSQNVHYIDRRGRLYKDAALGNPRNDVFDAVVNEMLDVKVPSWALADADSDSDDDGSAVSTRKIPPKAKCKGSVDNGTQSVSLVPQRIMATQPSYFQQPQMTQSQQQPSYFQQPQMTQSQQQSSYFQQPQMTQSQQQPSYFQQPQMTQSQQQPSYFQQPQMTQSQQQPSYFQQPQMTQSQQQSSYFQQPQMTQSQQQPSYFQQPQMTQPQQQPSYFQQPQMTQSQQQPSYFQQPRMTQPQQQVLPSISTILAPNQQQSFFRQPQMTQQNQQVLPSISTILAPNQQSGYFQQPQMTQSQQQPSCFQQFNSFPQQSNYGGGSQQFRQYSGYGYQPPFGNGGDYGGGSSSGGSGSF